jgi:hypothetical protein
VLQPERAATNLTQAATQAENPPTREEILQLTTSSSNIGLPDSNNKKPICKKPIRISHDMMVVAIPESIVQQLHIDEQRTWFQEIVTSEVIILKILSKEIG